MLQNHLFNYSVKRKRNTSICPTNFEPFTLELIESCEELFLEEIEYK